MGLSIDEFHDLTFYEAKLLTQVYQEEKENELNNLAFAVFYGVGSALSKKGFKPLKNKKVRKSSAKEKEQTLNSLFNKMGG